MNLAAIDFGSNSLRLLIARIESSNSGIRVKPLIRDARINQLGHSLHTDRIISKEAVEKSHRILEDYLAYIAEYNCAGLYAVATSVFRDSVNGKTVKKAFETHLKTPIFTLSGQEEAELFFNGILTNRIHNPEIHYGCFDIGGGSTEYIISHGTDIKNSVSLRLGCLRTKHVFFQHDPPTNREIIRFKQHVGETLKKQMPLSYTPDTFFGFGGTITTLARLITGKSVDDVENCPLSLKDIYTIFNSLSLITDSEIGQTFSRYIDTGRETVLRAGILIVIALMECLNSTEFTVTNQGILFGLLRQKYLLHTT